MDHHTKTQNNSANIILDKIINEVNEQSNELEDLSFSVLGLEPEINNDSELKPDRTDVSSKDNNVINDEAPELSAEDLKRFNKMMLKEGDTCPACSKGTLVLRKNDRVHFLGCSCFPNCKLKYFTSLASTVITLKVLNSICPECQSPLAVKKGRYGLFVGCSNYPECNYINKDSGSDELIQCPICSKGSLEKRRTYNGRYFYGCNHYPKCSFIVPGVPVVEQCQECGFPLSFKKKVKAGVALVCANPVCSTRRKRKYRLINS